MQATLRHIDRHDFGLRGERVADDAVYDGEEGLPFGAERALAAVGLARDAGDLPGWPYPADRLIEHMAQDKKAEAGRLTFILSRGIGDAIVARDVDGGELRAFLATEGATT